MLLDDRDAAIERFNSRDDDSDWTRHNNELVADLGLANAQARIAAREVKDELRRNTDEAIERGVFGVPTLYLGGEIFWGADATAMAADYAAAGCRWTEPEYARVAGLPVGAARAPKPRPAVRRGKRS